MKKKTFIVQLLDSKKPNRKSFTQVEDANFYSNDTDASLVFIPHEDIFDFQSAKVVMYNRSDESLVERDAVVAIEDGRKVASYEMPDEIIAHWGDWTAQPVFISGGEIYSGSIVPFSVFRYLMHERPPKLSEIVSVTNFIQQSQALVDDMAQKEAQRVTQEQSRQSAEAVRVQGYQEIKQIIADGALNAVPKDGSITTEKFSDGAVIPEVTNFFEISKNLFDFTDDRIVDGYILNDRDGTLTIMEEGNPLYYVSHPIRAVKGRPIFIPHVMRLALYDNSGNHIEGVRQSLGPLVYTPSENGYIKFASHKTGKAITDMQVEYGESETGYAPFVKKIKEEFLSEGKDIIVTPEQTTFFEKSKNIFNKNEVESGFYLSQNTGEELYIDSYETSGYVPMIKGVPVSINLVFTINFYDVQKNRIGGEKLASNQQHTFTPTFDGFFRFSYNAGVIPARLIQVEYNDTSTDFEPAYTRIKPEFIGSESKLSGKTLANFGDSIASAQTEGVDGYHEIISTKHSMTLHNFARNGAKVTNVDGETNHIKTQLDSAISAGIEPDYVLFDGLRNDVMNDINTVGEITTGYDQILNLTTFCGAFEYYCKTMRETWLEAKIIYVRTHNTSTVSYDRQKQLGELALEICEKYSIPVVDIWKEGGINTQFSGFVGPYTLTDTDATHPNTLGYEKFYVPLIESKMLSI